MTKAKEQSTICIDTSKQAITEMLTQLNINTDSRHTAIKEMRQFSKMESNYTHDKQLCCEAGMKCHTTKEIKH